MSGKVHEIGYKKDIGHCKFCQRLILWGYLAGKKHPYDVDFEKGRPHKAGSHMDTCPEWGDRKWLRLGDLNTEQIQKWRASCACPETYPVIDWKTVVYFDVPERHAQPIALKLVAKGAPFYGWHRECVIPHFTEVAVRDRKVVAVLVVPAVYNRIHQHLHGFWMSVFGDMCDRKPILVAGYRLEPSVVLQGCNLAESQPCRMSTFQGCSVAMERRKLSEKCY